MRPSDREWKEFFLSDLCTVGSGKRLTNADKIAGKRPFIGATDNNNGVTGFVDNINSSLDSNVLGVNYNGAPCIAFYHPYECIFTDDVKRLHLKNSQDNKYVLLFLKAVIAKQREKFNYGYKCNEQRMLRQKIMIPVTDAGEPDYQFMEDYIREVMAEKYESYSFENADLNSKLQIEEKKWFPFKIESLFERFEKGKCNNASLLKEVKTGGIEYVGATNRNNGVLYFVEINDKTSKMIQKGNCVGFVCDGQGSVGYAFYKQEDFVSTINVTYGYAPWVNRYTGIFVSKAQDLIRSKYGFGYKRPFSRLKNDKIMLPVTDAGEPDYDFMEKYTRHLMARKKAQYRNYVEKRLVELRSGDFIQTDR